jgi:SAM-dependent methyltransferase
VISAGRQSEGPETRRDSSDEERSPRQPTRWRAVVPRRLAPARRFVSGGFARHLLAWEARRCDEAFGIETGGEAEPSSLTLADGVAREGFTYVATPPRLARMWLDALPSNLGEYTFVDMGSGKGRVILLAALREFRRVVGVEFAVELHESSVANISRFRPPGRRRDLVPLLGDAALYEFPLEPLVVHFNNPFSELVMNTVVANLRSSYEQRPRPIVVVYQQLRVERPPHKTRNVELLRALPFLAHRPVSPRRLLDRVTLKPFAVDVFESPEAVGRE